MTAKDLRVAPISSQDARAFVRAHHYSHKTVANSQLHFGVFIGTRLEGAMQFGPSLDRRKLLTLVAGTVWNGMLELNRMVFTDRLPRNSESRALGVAMRLLRRDYKQIEWIVTFADGAQCGDGTIYRAAGFLLTGIQKNTTLWRSPEGHVISNVGIRTSGKAIQAYAHMDTSSQPGAEYRGGAGMQHFRAAGYRPIDGYQLRYICFVNPAARARLTVPVLDYAEIGRRGASMYRGVRAPKTSVGSIPGETAGHQPEEGGSNPTPTLQQASRPSQG